MARAALRQQDFDRQDALTLPAVAPAWLAALRPPLPVKLVAFGLERGMAKTKPVPGRHKQMVRFVTTLHDAALREGFARHLVAQGWPVKDRTLVAPIDHPIHGHLTVTITARAELATRVELVVEGQEAPGAPPLEDPTRMLRRPLEWLDDAVAQPIGYEFGHFHAVRFEGAITDVQRIAFAVRFADAGVRDAWRLRLADRAEAAGLRVEARDSLLFRGEDGGIFTVRTTDDPQVLVIHHQQRWTRAPRPTDGQPPPP
ncbi:MAG: hypothetical protein R3F43_28995 [bacterium]